MMKRYLLLPCSLLFSMMLRAQINESDTVKFQLRGTITGNYQKGNVEVTTIKNRLEFSYAPRRQWVFKSQNSSLYQTLYDKRADNDIFSRNYVYYNPQGKLYPFAIVYVSTNYRRMIDARYFAGAGVSYQLLRKPAHVIKFSASAVYEQTNFRQATYNYDHYNGSDKISLWRGTLYAAGWDYLFRKRLRFYYDVYWQPSFSDEHNYRTQCDVGVDFPVWKGLSLNALYTFTHENVEVTAVQQEDKILTFGIAYNLKIKQ